MSPLVEQSFDVSPEERTRLAEIERDNLDIVKSLRSNPDIVEYKSYSHFTESQKEHSLTATVCITNIALYYVKILTNYNSL